MVAATLIQPSLEHKYIPQAVFPIDPPGEMFAPHLSNRARAEIPVLPQPALTQKRFRPIAKGPAQPGPERYIETGLWAINDVSRYVPVKHLAKNPLALSLPDAHAQWKPPREFHDAWIQQRGPPLKTHCHSCPVEFD